MGLTEYHRKRDFAATAEPRGRTSKSTAQLQFVVQKHAASHLHYDLRIELDGVLKSWAVPKGPSLNPSQKRLAMQVEDHPVEYAQFEGIIPQGEYGGGTVMLWDRGFWQPIDDAAAGLAAGALKFELHGEKLQGRWMLVRRGGRNSGNQERHWFLFKENDLFARPKTDVTAESPLSVVTGRDLEQIAREAILPVASDAAVKLAKATSLKSRASKPAKKRPPKAARAAGKKAKGTSSPAARRKPNPRAGAAHRTIARSTVRSPSARAKSVETAVAKLPAARTPLPAKEAVELATLVRQPPDSDEWIHEIKYDGYRMLCRVDAGEVTFISRNGRNWTAKFPSLVAAAAALPIESGMLDGEVVALQLNGKTDFQALQNSLQASDASHLSYYAFDLLHVNGRDVKALPLEDRKQLLSRIVPANSQGRIRYSEHVNGHGPEFFAEASRLKLEGIISKRLGRPYCAGRGADWLKIKGTQRDEFVIGGFTKPAGARTNFGALLLGYHEAGNRKKIIYAGRVGAGFDQRTLHELHGRLKKLAAKQSPFANLSGVTGPARGVTWVKPELVAQVEFANWTNENSLRHPVYLGLRADKDASEVVREQSTSLRKLAAAASGKKSPSHTRKIPPATPSATASRSKSATQIAGVNLTHPEKLLYPEDGISKWDVANYYQQVAQWMLPHVANRLLTLVRCPTGGSGKCFYQKHPSEIGAKHFREITVPDKNARETYLAIDDLAGLISIVQMSGLEIHVWGSRADQFEKPDRLIFDLDPDPSVAWPQLIEAALEVKLVLEELGLASFLKTTGGKGLHIVVPISRRSSWAEAKTFCRAVADLLTTAAPERYVATMSKAARKGKIFVDYLRNDRGATAIAPYSTRARAHAPVSVPIAWDELNDRLTPNSFTIGNLPARLAKLKQDPWTDLTKTRQSLSTAMLKQIKLLMSAQRK